MKPELTQARLKHLLRLENGELIWNHGQRMRNKVAGMLREGRVMINVDGKLYEKSRLVALHKTGVLPPDPRLEKDKLRKQRKVESIKEENKRMNEFISRGWV